MKRILSLVVSIAIAAGVYAIINGGLIGIQSVFKQDEKAELELLEEELLAEENVIKENEEHLYEIQDRLNALDEEINAMVSNIDYYESRYPNGIPEDIYVDYTTSIDLYNNSLSEYESLFDLHEEKYQEYNTSIDNFNQKVEDAEKLAEEVGSTWVILPFGGRH